VFGDAFLKHFVEHCRRLRIPMSKDYTRFDFQNKLKAQTKIKQHSTRQKLTSLSEEVLSENELVNKNYLIEI